MADKIITTPCLSLPYPDTAIGPDLPLTRPPRLGPQDCAKNTAKCRRFRCRINNLKRNEAALVHIQGRIWNHTLVEDYDKVSYVSIKSRATIQMDSTLQQLQNATDDVASVCAQRVGTCIGLVYD